MSGLDRATFLARVREALQREGDVAPPPELNETIVRRVRPDADLVQVYIDNAVSVGLRVHAVTTDTLGERVAALVEELELRSVTLSLDGSPPAAALRRSLEEAGCVIVDWTASDGLDAHYDVDAGITTVQFAVAETGSLVYASGRDSSRGTFIVPPVHVALVRASQIVPDLVDAWASLRASTIREMPAATVFISGPSKTADIEGILITGVHGPREVHVLLLEDG